MTARVAGARRALEMLHLLCVGIDNGLGLRPPLGWRNFNAFYNPSQQIMEDTMDAMVDESRLVDGKPTSLRSLPSGL